MRVNTEMQMRTFFRLETNNEGKDSKAEVEVTLTQNEKHSYKLKGRSGNNPLISKFNI